MWYIPKLQLTFLFAHPNLQVFICQFFRVFNSVVVRTVVILITETARIKHLLRWKNTHPRTYMNYCAFIITTRVSNCHHYDTKEGKMSVHSVSAWYIIQQKENHSHFAPLICPYILWGYPPWQFWRGTYHTPLCLSSLLFSRPDTGHNSSYPHTLPTEPREDTHTHRGQAGAYKDTEAKKAKSI